jgi:hypothetical protein
MLPGNGTPVAGVSGSGEHERVGYCGHGGAGGVMRPAAWSCWISWGIVGSTIFADAVPVSAAQPASRPQTIAARFILNNPASRLGRSNSSN